MLPEVIFYFFVIPWIVLIATIPGVAMTFLFAGVGGQLLNYLPSERDKTKL